MQAFNELTTDEQNYIRGKISHLNVNPELLRPGDIQHLLSMRKPDDSSLVREHRGHQAVASLKTARRLQAEQQAKPGDGLPDESEVDEIARKFRVNPKFIRTRQQAIAEYEQQQQAMTNGADERQALRAAIKNRDVDYLVGLGNNSTDPELKAVARSAMAEILPEFNSWLD